MMEMEDNQQVVSKSKSGHSGKFSIQSKKDEKKREKELKKIAEGINRTRNFLTREENFSEKSIRRGWCEWEKWCQEIKIHEFKDELIVWSQSVNELLDRTQNATETIQAHFSHAEEQYMRNLQNHSMLIDYMMGKYLAVKLSNLNDGECQFVADLFKIFKNSIDKEYETERKHLISVFCCEAYDREMIHYQRQVYYENFEHATVSLTKCRMGKNSEAFSSRKVEIESASVVRREDLYDLSNTCELIACSNIRKLVNLFNNQLWPKSRFDEYKTTLEKSLKVDTTIDDLTSRIGCNVKIISRLDKELKNVSHEHILKKTELKTEQNFLIKIMKQAEQKVQREDAMDQAKIVQLVCLGDKIKSNLKKNLKQGKTIQAAIKICSKYEKLSDKLESFEIASSGSSPVDAFHKKLSQVEAQCLMLRSLKSSLVAQHEKLKAEVKEKSLESAVRHNFTMLELDSSPAVGQIYQESHQIPQIKASINLQKRYKLCKYCRNQFNF